MGLMHMIRVANLTYQSMCLNGCPLNCWGRNVSPGGGIVGRSCTVRGESVGCGARSMMCQWRACAELSIGVAKVSDGHDCSATALMLVSLMSHRDRGFRWRVGSGRADCRWVSAPGGWVAFECKIISREESPHIASVS